jgi:two-component system, OmpR family, alkaline phosphatase synthesis response regulator PhoP
MKGRILVVEDDAVLARVLRDNLTFEGFGVECVAEGLLAAERLRQLGPDLILLDINLPDCDGFELFELLRQAGPTPIIVLTARGQKADKLRGLKLGADDYVTKPFDLEELLARIEAVLRRSQPSASRLALGEVVVDLSTRSARRGAEEIRLTDRELEILRYLAERRNRIVHRSELLRGVWGYPEEPLTRSVDHAIARLRKKIEPDPHHPLYILTVHGDGYRLATPPSDEPPGSPR